MTVVRSAAPTVASTDADGGGPGERLRRLRQRRRLLREEFVAFRADALPRNPGGKVLKAQLRKETEWGSPLR